MTENPPTPQTERWQREREFFDRQAHDVLSQVAPISPTAIQRYGVLQRRYFSPEYRYRVLGDLRGRHVLDVGCGDGTNAAMLARLGATVTGIDISAGSIEVAQQRARVNGVAELTRFVCSPIELVDFREGEFDVIWCEAILHHLIADLESLMARLTRWARPDGVLLFAEPIVLSRALRRFRLMLPIRTDATPDERPLEDAELAVVLRYLRDPQLRLFGLLGRLDRFVIRNENYEESSAPRRAASMVLHMVDYAILSLPGLRRLAGTCVIHGHPARP